MSARGKTTKGPQQPVVPKVNSRKPPYWGPTSLNQARDEFQREEKRGWPAKTKQTNTVKVTESQGSKIRHPEITFPVIIHLIQGLLLLNTCYYLIQSCQLRALIHLISNTRRNLPC